MAAPALAASIADWAICGGVTGTAGFRLGVSAEPVTAHEIMTLRCMGPSSQTPESSQPRLGRHRRNGTFRRSPAKPSVCADVPRLLTASIPAAAQGPALPLQVAWA